MCVWMSTSGVYICVCVVSKVVKFKMYVQFKKIIYNTQSRLLLRFCLGGRGLEGGGGGYFSTLGGGQNRYLL